jgi:hypothetical protein
VVEGACFCIDMEMEMEIEREGGKDRHDMAWQQLRSGFLRFRRIWGRGREECT